jgi:hypothetical protein
LISHLFINELLKMSVAQKRSAGCNEERRLRSEKEEHGKESEEGNVRRDESPE